MPLSCIVLALAVLAVGGWSYDKGDTIMLDDDTMYEDLFSPDLIRQDIMVVPAALICLLIYYIVGF